MAAFDEIVALRHTNVSTPHLEHSSSKQSVTADEYHSARASSPESRPVSVESNVEQLTNPFSTPPQSRPVSASSHQQRYRASQEGNRTPTAATYGQILPGPYVPPERHDVEREPSESPTVRLVGNSNIPRKPVGSASRSPPQRVVSQMGNETRSPSPGQDNTPYIHFALDQLTRDEEVRGSRRYAYPSGVPVQYNDTNLRQAPEHDSTPFLDASLEDQQQQQQQRDSEVLSEHERRQSERQSAREFLATNHPLRTSSLPEQSILHEQVQEQAPELGLFPNVFVPYEQEVPALRFRPSILRLPAMLGYVLLVVLMITGLAFSGGWSGTHNGLYEYTQFGGGRYFVFEYLPTILGTVLLLWLFQIQIALQRIAPFTAMASLSAKSRSEASLMPIHPTNFMLPKLFYFRAGLPMIGVVMILFWLQIFTVPLLTCVFNVYFYGTPQTGSWRWTAVQGVIWATLALYVLQLVALVLLIVWLRNQRTGMLWDYRSLADYVTLLDHSNVLRKYTDTETFPDAQHFRDHLHGDTDRLGYWHTSNRPAEAFYGLGEEGAAIRRYSIERGKLREKSPLEHSSFPSDTPTTAVNDRDSIDLESSDEFQKIRHHYLPWIIRPSAVLLWSIAAILLYIAFLVASYVNRAVLHGFSPLTQVDPTSAGFSATNFTYSFIPALIAQFCFLAWLSIDYAFRRLQPYANMSRSGHTTGAVAADSILLDYPARLPFSITFSALIGKDFRIAWYSIVTLLTATLPTLAGGCFWAQFYISAQQVRVSVDPSAYYALCVFLALLAFSLPTALIGLRKRRLPHPVTTLAEQISFLYQADFLSDKGSQNRSPLGSKAQLTTRMMHVRPASDAGYGIERITSGGDHRFMFGRFVGRDGKVHCGVHSNAPRRHYDVDVDAEHERWETPPVPQLPEKAMLGKPLPGEPHMSLREQQAVLRQRQQQEERQQQREMAESSMGQRLDERVRLAGLGQRQQQHQQPRREID
ncbi:MAG: hypothetical protein M1828_006318 [Chrysothrix sp. TS-e1954]|nr:MAG: hypothetical protein M1828_006318 [Chrysothrix sp. TS-e1954]